MLKICHLYPDLLNLHGGRGNVIAFTRRCGWRDIPVSVYRVNSGKKIEFRDLDFLFIGSGPEKLLDGLVVDLKEHIQGLEQAIEDGMVVLATGTGYQLLGKYYLMPGGKKISGLGLLDLHTEAHHDRLVGNVAVEIKLDDAFVQVTGYENHKGRTFLHGAEALGKVLAGQGNNGIDGLEGARYRNVFGTYLQGPLLPKNPVLTDYMISMALQRQGKNIMLPVLDNNLEEKANQVMLKRLLK